MRSTATKRALVAIPALGLIGMVASLAPAGASLAPRAVAHAAPSCSIVTPALIKSDLGLSTAPAQTQTGGGEVHCYYKIGSNPLGVQISFFPESFSTYQQVEKAYTSGGAKVLSGIGQSSFATSIHTTGVSNSDVYFYAGGIDASVGAAVALADVEKLAKTIASKL